MQQAVPRLGGAYEIVQRIFAKVAETSADEGMSAARRPRPSFDDQLKSAMANFFSPARRGSFVGCPHAPTCKTSNTIRGLARKRITEQSFGSPNTQLNSVSQKLRLANNIIRDHLKMIPADFIEVGQVTEVDIPGVGNLPLVALTSTADI